MPIIIQLSLVLIRKVAKYVYVTIKVAKQVRIIDDKAGHETV